VQVEIDLAEYPGLPAVLELIVEGPAGSFTEFRKQTFPGSGVTGGIRFQSRAGFCECQQKAAAAGVSDRNSYPHPCCRGPTWGRFFQLPDPGEYNPCTGINTSKYSIQTNMKLIA